MNTAEPKTIVKPFVKWIGSKKQHLPVFRTLYPSGLGSAITKYAEPFVGGGTVLFDILSTYNLDEIYISDTNESLINTYLVIKNKCDELIERLTGLNNEYSGKSFDERKSMYYRKRDEFNNVKRFSNFDEIEIAALFIFLNKTCFNGVYRVNSKNEFNVPSGRYKNPKILDVENLLNVSQKLKRVTICCDDFRNVLPFVDEHTFVYFDPPYRPITPTASFTSYTPNGFGDIEQRALATLAREIDLKLGKFLLSNSNPKNINPNDTYFDDLYSGFNINTIQISRYINPNVDTNDKKIKELIISNYV